MTSNGWKVLARILILTILFTSAGTFVIWDYYRVDRDFSALKALLQDTRYRAIGNDKTFVARFSGKEVAVSDKNIGLVIKTLIVPTLDEVNYNTTLGDNMIVFDGHGTADHNKKIHGGDLTRMATSKYPTCGRVKIPHPLWATNRKNHPRLGEDFQRQKRV